MEIIYEHIFEINENCLIMKQINNPKRYVFSYGFHGRRKEVFHNIMPLIANNEYNFVPLLLWCDEEKTLKD